MTNQSHCVVKHQINQSERRETTNNAAMGDASVESYLREGNDANVIAVTVTA